jgi:hypothetical protein
MTVNVPTVPTSGDDKEFGLQSLNKGAYLKFDITDAVFKIQASDGTTTSEATVSFVTGWEGADTVYRIKWESGRAEFYVAGQKVGTLTGDSIPFGPMSIWADNNDADNLDIKLVEGKSIQGYI